MKRGEATFSSRNIILNTNTTSYADPFSSASRYLETASSPSAANEMSHSIFPTIALSTFLTVSSSFSAKIRDSQTIQYGVTAVTDGQGNYAESHLKEAGDYRISVRSDALDSTFFYAIPSGNPGDGAPAYSVLSAGKATPAAPARDHLAHIDVIVALKEAPAEGSIQGSVFLGPDKSAPAVGVILRWDGAGWTAMENGVPENLTGVWGSADADVYVVGENCAVSVITSSMESVSLMGSPPLAKVSSWVVKLAPLSIERPADSRNPHDS